MDDPTKSVSDVKESVSQHVSGVNASVANAKANLEAITQNIVEEKTSTIKAVKEQTANNIKQVHSTYVHKEEKVYEMLGRQEMKQLETDYEMVLRENVAKLRDIAHNDFEKANENSKKLIENAKHSLGGILTQANRNQDLQHEFAQAAESIFISVNEKLWEDFHLKNKNVERTRSSIGPDYGQIFVLPTIKPDEEIEAERLLQQLFEDQLLDYSKQFKMDFQERSQAVTSQVANAKQKLNDTFEAALPQDKPRLPNVQLKDATSLPNLPTKSTVEQNINTLLNKADNDFRTINDSMRKDVERNQNRVNEKVKYVAEKILGKDFLGNVDDEEE